MKPGKTILIILLNLTGMLNAENMAYVQATGPNLHDGKPWPVPRFKLDTSGNCVIDNLTGLMWPKNAIIGFKSSNNAGLAIQPDYNNVDAGLNKLSWTDAKEAINKMNFASLKLCGYSSGWRLPNINELRSILNYSTYNNMPTWLSSQGFNNVQNNTYWSATTTVQNLYPWYVDFSNSSSSYSHPNPTTSFVWPVRSYVLNNN